MTNVVNTAAEGDVYKIDLQDGKPWHYWIVLNTPNLIDGKFLIVSLTDRNNFPRNMDVWPLNYSLCASVPLAKSSVISLPHARVKDQVWLNAYNAVFVCQSTPIALQRARCNLIWFPYFLRPETKTFVRRFHNQWEALCGPAPQNPPKDNEPSHG